MEPYRYKTYLSDIAGQDPKAHGNDLEKIIPIVRDYLSTSSQFRMPGGKQMTKRYKQFLKDLPQITAENQIEVGELTCNDWTDFIAEWIEADAAQRT